MRAMSIQRSSGLGLVLRRMPLPVFALVLGMLVGGLAWLVIDRFQTRALSDIFDKTLSNQLDQVARESLIRFDEHRRSFVFLTRLLANHRRMQSYLGPIVWPEESKTLRTYHSHQPSWLPRERIWSDLAQPSHLMLADPSGGLREVYSLSGEPLPSALMEDPVLFLAASQERAFLTTIDGLPYLLVSEPVEDAGHFAMGSLVVLVPVDSAFLAASQRTVQSTQGIAAVLDPDAQTILATSDPLRIEAGTQVQSIQHDYVVTAQSFFDYDDSDLNMLYATLLPKAAFQATSEAVLDLERRQRAMGTAAVVAIFVAMFLLVSARINRVLKRLQTFARRAFGEERRAIARPGNQLLVLEERILEVIDLVLRAREETRSRHETEVRKVESLRAAVMEASVDSIATIDAEGTIIDFNPTAQKTFELPAEGAHGRSLSKLIFDHSNAVVFAQMLERCQGHQDTGLTLVRQELQATGPEGHAFAVEVTIKPVVLEQQILFTVYLRDITERKAREKEIRSLAAFPEESPSPVLRVNGRGVITYANAPSQALLRHWGVRPAQTLPIFWKDVVADVLANGIDREFEINSEQGIFSLLLTPVPDSRYVNIYGRDITAQRRAEDALRQRQNELVHVARLSTMGEMSTGIAHELNQPLSAIVNFSNGCARRLRLDIGGKDEMLSALGQIATQANRAAEIIKRLRSLVTRQQIVRREVDLNRLIVEACDLMAHELRKYEVAVERRLHGGELLIKADSVQIEQVLLNLMRNALDSMASLPPLERRLVIQTGYQPDGMLYASVRDNGEGIRPADMEHLFDAFFTTKDSGMGMGLAITQTIIEDHRGKIRADSWPGKGSTFTIELPPYIESAESIAS